MQNKWEKIELPSKKCLFMVFSLTILLAYYVVGGLIKECVTSFLLDFLEMYDFKCWPLTLNAPNDLLHTSIAPWGNTCKTEESGLSRS